MEQGVVLRAISLLFGAFVYFMEWDYSLYLSFVLLLFALPYLWRYELVKTNENFRKKYPVVEEAEVDEDEAEDDNEDEDDDSLTKRANEDSNDTNKNEESDKDDEDKDEQESRKQNNASSSNVSSDPSQGQTLKKRKSAKAD